MLYEILDMTSSYIQYLLLLFTMAPDALSELRHSIEVTINYFEMSYFNHLNENQRYNKQLLGIDLPLWLPLNASLQFATLCIITPLVLSLITVLVLETKLVFIWFVTMLASLFCFTFGVLLWANTKTLNIWNEKYITEIDETIKGNPKKGGGSYSASKGVNSIDPAISIRVWMACAGAFISLMLFMMIWPFRRAHKRSKAKIRDKLRQFEREEKEKKTKKALKEKKASSQRRSTLKITSDEKDIATLRKEEGVREESWMTTKALAEHRLEKWQSNKILARINHTDILVQMIFSCVLFIFGLIAVNVIPLFRKEGKIYQVQTSMVLRVVGAIFLVIACLSMLWGLLGFFRGGRSLQLILREYTLMILLKLTMLAASLLYTVVATNLVSMLSCHDVVCGTGMRLANGRTHFPYYFNSTVFSPSVATARVNLNKDPVHNLSTGCIVCNADEFKQNCSPLWIAQICNASMQESRITKDARVSCNSKRGLSLSSEVCISILYLLFLPIFQYIISRYAIRLVTQDFPIEQRLVDILSDKELVMEKLHTCDNEAMFLYRAYKPEFCYFKISLLFQRVLLAVISTVISYDPKSSHQRIGILLFFTISLTMAGVLITLRPFSFPTEAIYFPTIQIMVTVASGVLLIVHTHGKMTTWVSSLLIVMLVGVPTVAFVIGAILDLRGERGRHDRLLERLKRRFIIAQRFPGWMRNELFRRKDTSRWWDRQRRASRDALAGTTPTPATSSHARARRLSVAIPVIHFTPCEMDNKPSDTVTHGALGGDSVNEYLSNPNFELTTSDNVKRMKMKSDELNTLSNSASLVSVSKVVLPELAAPCPEYDLCSRLFTPSLYFIQPLRQFYGQEQRGLQRDLSRELSTGSSLLSDSATEENLTNLFGMMSMEYQSEARHNNGGRDNPMKLGAPLKMVERDEDIRGGNIGTTIINYARRLKSNLVGSFRALFGKVGHYEVNKQGPEGTCSGNLPHTRSLNASTMCVTIGRMITCRPSGVLQKTYFAYLKFQRILHSKQFLFRDSKGEQVYKRYCQLHTQLLHSLDKVVLSHTEIMELRRLYDLSMAEAFQKGSMVNNSIFMSIFRPFKCTQKNPVLDEPYSFYLTNNVGCAMCFPGNISVHDIYLFSKKHTIFNPNNFIETVPDEISCFSANQTKDLSFSADSLGCCDASSSIFNKKVNFNASCNGNLSAQRMFSAIRAILQKQRRSEASLPLKESCTPFVGSSIPSSAQNNTNVIKQLSQHQLVDPRSKSMSRNMPIAAPVSLSRPIFEHPKEIKSVSSVRTISPSKVDDAARSKWLHKAVSRLDEMRSHALKHSGVRFHPTPADNVSDSDNKVYWENFASWSGEVESLSFCDYECPKEAQTPADLSSTMLSSCEDLPNPYQNLYQNFLHTYEVELLAVLKERQRGTKPDREVARVMQSSPHLFFQLQTHDSEHRGLKSTSMSVKSDDTVNLQKRLCTIPMKIKSHAAHAPSRDDAENCAMRLRCHYIQRQVSRTAFFKQNEHLLQVQNTINKKTDAAVGYVFSRFFMILGICATITLALTIGGMIYEVDTHYLDGTREPGEALVYALAGYSSWETFTENCLCTATSNATTAFPFYITDAEEWICRNGMTKERVRRSGAVGMDEDGELHDGYRVRPLCGMTFLAGCRLEVQTPTNGAGAVVRLVGCPEDFHPAEIQRW
ncbi:unnamed protein product [Phytomonas sp. Hart1]|nr:unnamed protein product [Phytomonas sp. Hart1]|eukprot:CCW71370.1 unnamed protein product [Phytomonas sp. isolate Hart1]